MGSLKFSPLGDETGAKAQNVEWFAADIVPEKNGIIHIFISHLGAEDIEFTLDSGATWNNLTTTVANISERHEIPVTQGDQFNMRITSVAPANLDRCLVSLEA